MAVFFFTFAETNKSNQKTMAKTDQMLRIKFIEDLLRRKKETGASFNDIRDYLEQKFTEKDKIEELKFTPRTFLRDKEMISEISGIEISYSRSRKAYYIKSEELDIYQENIFDNLLLVEAYRETKNHGDIMIFEPRKSRGLENLHGLIHAIKNQKIVTFRYMNYWTDTVSDRVVEPYALKEFAHRWYLLARDHNPKDGNKVMKSFALDRLSALDFKSSFKKEKYDPAEQFRNSFGIISPDAEAQEIILWFDRHQGNYIKSLPLHHSQQILQDDESGLKIKLFLVPTFDFKQAVLSFGARVKVISPETFKTVLKIEVEAMLTNLK